MNSTDSRLFHLSGIHLDEIIGRGKYSTVYRGVDRFPVSLPVAVKLTNTSNLSVLSCGDTLREAVIWKDISHQNIVAFYAAFRVKDVFLLILEYIPGQNLLNYMLELPNHLVNLPSAEQWILQLGEALDYLHRNSVVHRDVKLENIFVGEQVKLGDFGYAKKVIVEVLEDRCCGSTNYAAPQILLGIPYDAKAGDVWAFGCVCYALLTGALPFTDTVALPIQLAMQKQQVFEWNHFYRYSRSTKCLVESMMRFKEIERISMKAFLRSEFVLRISRGSEKRKANNFFCCLS